MTRDDSSRHIGRVLRCSSSADSRYLPCGRSRLALSPSPARRDPVGSRAPERSPADRSFEPRPEPLPSSARRTGTGTRARLFNALDPRAVVDDGALAGSSARIPGGKIRFDDRTGEALQLDVGAVIAALPGFDGVPKIFWLNSEPDEFQGDEAFATGGQIPSIVPGLRSGLAERADLEAAVDLPVVRDLPSRSRRSVARFSMDVTLALRTEGRIRVRPFTASAQGASARTDARPRSSRSSTASPAIGAARPTKGGPIGARSHQRLAHAVLPELPALFVALRTRKALPAA